MNVTDVFGVPARELEHSKTVHGWYELDRWDDGELTSDTHARWLAGRLLETMRGLWAWERLPLEVRTTEAGGLVLDALLTGYSESCTSLHAHHTRREEEERQAARVAYQGAATRWVADNGGRW